MNDGMGTVSRHRDDYQPKRQSEESMRRAIPIMVALLCCAGCADTDEDTTVIKLSLFPGLSVPSQRVVHGLDISFIGSDVDEVQGLQISGFSCAAKKMVGWQEGAISTADILVGIQSAPFFNSAKSAKGVQVGVVNAAGSMTGVQFGLINTIEKGGVFPFMIGINGGF